jgi:Na+-driven multidrug efflux pump
MEGTALATVISQFVVFISGLGYFFSRHSTISLTSSWWICDFGIALKSLRLGVSLLFMHLYLSMVLAIHNALLIKYGTQYSVTAFAIVGYLMSIYYLFAEGISEGAQPLMSYYLGAKKPEFIRYVFWTAAKIIIVLGIISTCLLNLTPEFYIAMFNTNEQVMSTTTVGIQLHLFALFLDGFIALAAVYFMAINKTGKALFISIGNMLIQLPFLFVLPKLIGEAGVWLAMPSSNIVFIFIVAPLVWHDLKTSNQLCSSGLSSR